MGDHGGRLDALETYAANFRQETHGNFRSMDEQLAEIKDLIIADLDSTRRSPLARNFAGRLVLLRPSGRR